MIDASAAASECIFESGPISKNIREDFGSLVNRFFSSLSPCYRLHLDIARVTPAVVLMSLWAYYLMPRSVPEKLIAGERRLARDLIHRLLIKEFSCRYSYTAISTNLNTDTKVGKLVCGLVNFTHSRFRQLLY